MLTKKKCKGKQSMSINQLKILKLRNIESVNVLADVRVLINSNT